MRGGLRLLAHKQSSTLESIAEATVPARLIFTLRNASDVAVLVQENERVALGQILARSAATSVLASASGTIAAVERNEVITVTLVNDGHDTLCSDLHPLQEPELSPPGELRDQIARAGIIGLGGAGFSTAAKLDAAVSKHTRLLIINAAECEPFISCDDMLMREHADDIVRGIRILLHACGATRAVIAIENDKPQAIAAMARSLAEFRDDRLRQQVIGAFYPAGGEHQLVKAIAEREVPTGGIPSDIGILCHNVGTAAAVARFAKTGIPLVSRIVTVTGFGVRTPRNLHARFGTPIASLIADCGGYAEPVSRLIIGGSMMGVAQATDATTITATTNCIVAATTRDLTTRGPEMPCVRCGDCAEVCPAGLLPQQLLRYVRLNDAAALREFGLRDCIECGCCDYVCPSQIPITEHLRQARHLKR